jgi:hypothetical protein
VKGNGVMYFNEQLKTEEGLICIIGTNSYTRKHNISGHIIADVFRCRLHHPQGRLY